MLTDRFRKQLRRHGVKAEVVLDVGSRDGLQALELRRVFPYARVFAFEARPEAAGACRANTAHFPTIQVVEGAVHNVHRLQAPFFPVVSAKLPNGRVVGNEGASSLFRATNDGYVETYEQTETLVATLRLDRWAQEACIDRFDVVWMDLQGAELLALEGMGHLLATVQALHIELTKRRMYDGQAMYDEVDAYLRANGLIQVAFHEGWGDWWGDGIYIRAQ